MNINYGKLAQVEGTLFIGIIPSRTTISGQPRLNGHPTDQQSVNSSEKCLSDKKKFRNENKSENCLRQDVKTVLGAATSRSVTVGGEQPIRDQ